MQTVREAFVSFLLECWGSSLFRFCHPETPAPLPLVLILQGDGDSQGRFNENWSDTWRKFKASSQEASSERRPREMVALPF